MKFGILKNEFDDNHDYWAKACTRFGHDFVVIDSLSAHWLELCVEGGVDAILGCPSGRETFYKEMYDEKIYILDKVLKMPVYPSYDETSIHENKKYLSYWLRSNNIPHPKTFVFYELKEALLFAETCKFPVVVKVNIGASGQGVEIIKTKERLIAYIGRAFSSGIRQNWGPNLKMGGIGKRLLKAILTPSIIKKRLTVYKKVYNEVQRNMVILQYYVEHSYEWRVVKIGDSYFGHQKVKQGDKASGTKGIDYIIPPDSLLNFVRELCEKHNFNSMAVDLFEDGEGGYLVNEMQCIFGHVQDYICEKEGKPGRLRFIGERWVFEEGFFNSNLSYDLRIQNVVNLIAQ